MKADFEDHRNEPQDQDPFDETLRGLDGLRILIESTAIRPEVVTDGFVIEDLQEELESALKDSSIKVLSISGWEENPRRPTLHVSPDVTKINPIRGSDLQVYSYHVTVAVNQACAIKGEPVKSYLLPTWSKSVYGMASNLETIRASIKSLLSALIKTFRKANPGKPHLALCVKPRSRKER